MKSAIRALGAACVAAALAGASTLSHAGDSDGLAQPGAAARHTIMKRGDDPGTLLRAASRRGIPSTKADVGKYGLFEAPEHDDRRPPLYERRGAERGPANPRESRSHTRFGEHGGHVWSTDSVSYGEERPMPFEH